MSHSTRRFQLLSKMQSLFIYLSYLMGNLNIFGNIDYFSFTLLPTRYNFKSAIMDGILIDYCVAKKLVQITSSAADPNPTSWRLFRANLRCSWIAFFLASFYRVSLIWEMRKISLHTLTISLSSKTSPYRPPDIIFINCSGFFLAVI